MSVHRETFVELVKQKGWTRGAELGVDKGILFGMLLRTCPDLTLIGVDTFPDRERSRRVFDHEKAVGKRARVMQMTTTQAINHVDDGSLDFVFIDADHSEAAVTEDIYNWRPKVKKGGWFGGHDYRTRRFPGVYAAVKKAFPDGVQEWPGNIWGVFL
jgi:predicted O-methyltransferase YrrM